MIYGKIPNFDKKVSRIIFGCAVKDMSAGKDASRLLDSALECGINTFDTARVYGKSEYSLGKWLKQQNREELIVITKGCHPSPLNRRRVNRKGILSDLEKSLNTLEVDYVDIYLLHRDDPLLPVDELVETLSECKSKGLIRAFGGSNWRYERIKEANNYAELHGLSPFACSSPYFGLAEQLRDIWGGGVALSGAENAPARKWYTENNFPVFSYCSLGHGFFAGKINPSVPSSINNLDRFAKKGFLSDDNLKRLERAIELASQKNCSVSDIALSWIFSHGMNVFATVGASSPERVRANANSTSIVLTEKESDWLNLES
ncbi:MAG: aldo/keto reductase [Clostridiales bacterium]|nr:aldo/keto reductase [Clostridiales bacterium]